MHQTTQGTLHPAFSSRQPPLSSTAKPVTPFGGLVSLIEFFNSLKVGEVLGRLMPLAYQGPQCHPSRAEVAGLCHLHHRWRPEQKLLAFVISIIVGARRSANLLIFYQQAVGSREEKHYQRPATLRSSVFIGGAILGKRGRQPVLHIAQSRGGAQKHQPLIDKLLAWRKRTSPKLEPPAHIKLETLSKTPLNFGIRV